MIFKTDRGGRVAISYALSDKAEAKRLAGILNRYRTPRQVLDRQTKFGFAPSRFEASLMPNHESAADMDLSSEAKLALREADHLVVLCSAKAAEDRWIDEEARTFLAHRKLDNESGRLHPVFLPGSGERKLPTPITEENLDPVADLSVNKDGWEQGSVKLISSLLGMDLDLVMRANRTQVTAQWLQLGFSAFVAIALAGAAAYVTFSGCCGI